MKTKSKTNPTVPHSSFLHWKKEALAVSLANSWIYTADLIHPLLVFTVVDVDFDRNIASNSLCMYISD